MYSGKMQAYRGVYALLLTPFKEDRSIDYDVYAQYVQWQAEKKPHFLFTVCGSSEMVELTLDERIKVATTAVKNSGGVPCVATANIEKSFEAQIEEVKRMEQTGVDGLVFVTKGYADDDEKTVSYLSELAQKTTLPVVLYEFPGFKPHCISANAYAQLAKTGKIVGIKDTTCTMPAIKEKIDVQGETAVLQANIPFLFDAYEAGARGVVATPTSCGAGLFRKMYDEYFSGDIDAARKTYHNIILLDNAIDSGFCASAKYLVSLQGIGMNWYTRGDHMLSPARMRSIEAYYEWAKENNALF